MHFIQRICCRVRRDTSGVPEVLLEVLTEVLPEGQKLPNSIKGRAERSVRFWFLACADLSLVSDQWRAGIGFWPVQS